MEKQRVNGGFRRTSEALWHSKGFKQSKVKSS